MISACANPDKGAFDGFQPSHSPGDAENTLWLLLRFFSYSPPTPPPHPSLRRMTMDAVVGGCLGGLMATGAHKAAAFYSGSHIF